MRARQIALARGATALGSAVIAGWLWSGPVLAGPAEEAIVGAAEAFAAGRGDEVRRLDGQISAARAALPAWVEEKRAAAAQVPQGRQRVMAMWSRARQQVLQTAQTGDGAQATEQARQALALARDNLGEGHLATVVSAGDLAALLAQGPDPDAAEAAYRQAIALARGTLGEGHPDTLALAEGLAGLARAHARFDLAAETLATAQAAAAKALGADHPRTLDLGGTLAAVRLDQGRATEAWAVLEPVCAATGRAFGAVHPETAQCLSRQGAVQRGLGDYGAAAHLVEKARAVEALALAADDPAALATRIELARIQHRQGRFEEARDGLEAVRALARTPASASVKLDAQAELVDVLSDMGALDAAEALAREQLAAVRAQRGDTHTDTLAALSSLAAVQRQQGRLIDAEKTFEQAWEGYRALLGDGHRATLIAANNMGEILEKEGLFDRAEPYLRGALDGARKAFGDSHPATLTAMNNLALLYESQGLFDKAEPLYQGVIAVFSRVVGPRHPDTIAATNNLAYLYMLKGEYPRAAQMFREVHAAWSKALGAKHQNTLKAYNNLGRALLADGKLAEAEPVLTKALAIRRAALGERHLDTLRSMHDVGTLYFAQKKLAEAETLLARTLALDEQVVGPAHPYTFETMNSLARVREAKGALDAAFDLRTTLVHRRTDFLNRVLYVTGDNAREGYVRLYAPELAAYVALLTRIDEARGAPALIETALNRKGLLLKVASEVQQTARLARDPALAKIAAELTETRKKLAALTLSGPTNETRDTHAEVISRLEERVDTLQGDLGRASARFQGSVSAVSLDDLVAALPADAALVDYFVLGDEGRQSVVAGVLRKEGGRPVWGLVRLGDLGPIAQAVQTYRTDIQNEEIELDDLLDSGEKVYGLVWKPLADRLGGRKTVYVVPDGILNILPFSALVEPNRKYLIERADLHLLSSSRDLLPRRFPAAKGGTMINAGPDYNTDAVVGKEEIEKARSRSAGGAVQSALRGMSGLRGLKFDPLPGAEKEGQLIVNTVTAQGQTATIHSRADAQEKVLRDLEQPPEVLHIATHGFFLKADDTLRKRLLKLQRSGDFQVPPPGDNPLLRAGLAFAGINANAQVLGEIDTDNDGVLTALEVLGLDLTGTRLAILSACETGLGEIHEGEGVYGLRRAFQEAGVQSVVSSLWEVSDAGTQTLMAALYKRLLAGKTPHDALREAQLEMLKNSQWSMPYIWSAFSMVGG